MSNEWKELKIDNLPPDILTGDYELMVNGYDCKQRTGQSIFKQMIVDLFNGCEYQYRKPEPKPPTHEEILKPRFWQMDNKDYWRSIVAVRSDFEGLEYLLNDAWCNNEYFIGRESADIPPEAE